MKQPLTMRRKARGVVQNFPFERAE